jgi:hypothetical protein
MGLSKFLSLSHTPQVNAEHMELTRLIDYDCDSKLFVSRLHEIQKRVSEQLMEEKE